MKEIKLPTCVKCQALLKNPPVLAPTPARLLRTPGEVIAATDHLPSDGEVHAAHPTGVLYRYQLTTMIPCSFPDGTRHKLGYVIRTLCGRILQIGKDCGKSNIVGFDAAVAEGAKLDQFHNDWILIQSAPEILLRRARRMARDIEHISRFCASVDNSLPRFAEEMRKRAAIRGSLGTTVYVQYSRYRTSEEPDFPPTVQVSQARSLQGLTAWEGSPVDVNKEALALRDSVHAELERNHNPDAEEARVMAREIDRVRKRLDRAEEWISRANGFFTEENLAIAVAAAGMLGEVNVDQGCLSFFDAVVKRKPVWVGLRGIFLKPPVHDEEAPTHRS